MADTGMQWLITDVPEAINNAGDFEPWAKVYTNWEVLDFGRRCCAAALASRPAEVDDERQWFVVGGRRAGRTFMANLARDAARYRWLRELSNIEAASIVDFHSGDSMDVRVDQAMARAAAGQGSK